jgi:hypothetical protein
MRRLLAILVQVATVAAQSPLPQLPPQDAVRIREFYRLAGAIQDQVWPGWSATPAPLLLVTPEAEFLSRFPHPPEDFQRISDDLYARRRHFPAEFQATFPAFGPPSLMVIGEPEHTQAKRSTPWLFVAMHEHFHQLQDGQPGLNQAVEKLGLARGDTTGMWMLNYPFPYGQPGLGASFARLRDVLLAALRAPDGDNFQRLAGQYAGERGKFMAQLTVDDRKYLSFQLWKEGIARYVQIRCAEAAAGYRPAPEFAALPDYESFEEYARDARTETLEELQKADLAAWQRGVVYSFGAGEGLLLDREHPKWKEAYFQNLFTLDPYFQH